MLFTKCNIEALIISIIIVILILVEFVPKKILGTILLKKPRISMWQISHFLLFMFFGFKCKDQYIFYIMIGILWEIFEYIYGYINNNIVYWTSGGIKGQLMDIIMNILGYIIGNIIG